MEQDPKVRDQKMVMAKVRELVIVTGVVKTITKVKER